MINFRNIKFIKSAINKEDALLDLPNVVFIGRSNVGKSTLINLIADNKGLAFVSKRPGQTKLLNYFNVDRKFYLVDAPGYGYRKTGKKDDFDKMMDSYFNENESLKLVIWLLDSRRTLSKEDIDFYEFLKDLNVKSLLVFTKSDKLNQSEKSKVIKMAKENLSEFEYILTSSLNKRNIEDLRKKIEIKLYED
ncbi:MAG: YihA family ribosome biogenesis GTP-binding protein [Erysipelotrichaceae bacterium]|nr:YihA family ribosome biogenesis GTP-binding protein [Erysipelotrichaceae bacterium]